VFTRPLHWSLSWDRSIKSIQPYPISLRSILILSSHLRLGLPSDIFPFGFPTKILYAIFFSPTCATFPAPLILLVLIILIIPDVERKLWRSSFRSFSNFLPFHSSSFQIRVFSSAPCSQTPTIYVFSFMSEIEFHTRGNNLHIRIQCSVDFGTRFRQWSDSSYVYRNSCSAFAVLLPLFTNASFWYFLINRIK
jgi:hypothetical protein